jgi:hypothetical protein
MIVVQILAGLLLVYVVWKSLPAITGFDDIKEVTILKGSRAGDIKNASTTATPLSFNQPEGLTYSYTAWVLVKDFAKGYGQRRTIFSKDDAPGLYIDSTSNSLVVAIQTFGATETILIPSVPAMKWLHIGIVVDQQAVDIFINGTLRQHHTLGQLPKQTLGATTMGGGWDGVVSEIKYYPRALKHTEIKKLSQEKTPDPLQKTPAAPQYFDISWYTGRFYSA